MYNQGHTGISLILYSPVNALLITNSLYLEAIVGLAIVLSFSSLPDLDIKTSIVKHRGFTHTIWFAIIMGLFCAFLVHQIPTQYKQMFGASENAELIIFLIGTMAIVNHIIGDMITPMGIKPLSLGKLNNVYPIKKYDFTSKKYRFVITSAKNKNYNVFFLALGFLFIIISFTYSILHQMGLLGPTISILLQILEIIYQAFENFFDKII